MPDEKGVSPLIATVILIAFVVAVAAIASQFLTSFTQGRQAELREEGKQTVDCGISSIEIDPDSVRYDSSRNELRLAVENTGRQDLAIEDIVYSNTTDEIRDVVKATRHSDNSSITSDDPLTVGEIVTIHNHSVGYQPDDVTVTTECPGVTASATNASSDEFEQEFD